MVYDIVDGTAVGETHYSSNGTATMYMMYIHDENGAVNGIGLWYPGNTEWTYYHFVKNLQGDVLEVYNEDHSCVASYTYDSWGNILSKSGSLADINPFRYRGYYFDTETWFYYLQSRYYDPAIGRFINADILTSTGQGILGNNMFAYCGNNPIDRIDAAGYMHKAIEKWDICSSGGAGGALALWYPFVWAVDIINTIADTSNFASSQKEETQSNIVASTLISSETGKALYYGADIVGDAKGTKEWRIRTGPMDYETAVAWTLTTANSHTYGKNARWGLYTSYSNDAQHIAISLGGIGPCFHGNRVGEYPHFHVNGMLLFGEYKHFHIWYGNIYSG